MSSDEANQSKTDGNVNLAQFRIFLASPGDVPLERKLAREAITHIGSEHRFRNRIDLEIIAWDQPGAAVAMEAGLTPQEAIAQGLPKPEDCDLAVIILWSRIGTQLPSDFKLKADGSPYLSGTEWEYLNAINGFKTNHKPGNVWVFRRMEIPKPALNDPHYETIVEQWKKLEKFFAAFSNPDGSIKRGVNEYNSPDEFRQKFEQLLRDRLDKLLETLPPSHSSLTPGKSSVKPLWTESPYPGLEAFTPEQAPIYFGRGREVDQLLQQFADPKVRFVAVVGVSGSGKSSLVKAGLLPRLRAGIIGNAPWIDLIFKPGERGGNPYLALAFVLKAALKLGGQTETELAGSMQSDRTIAARHLAALRNNHAPAAELLLVVDQFEELFTQCRSGDAEDFIGLLEHLVSQPKIRAVVTLRADFYAEAIKEPVLANLLRQDRGSFPLDLPGVGAIHDMIMRPAEAAGVVLQDGLAQLLLDEAGTGPGAMALIAYTLNQLYEQERHSHTLSIDAYTKTLGGVKGAVQKRADTALEGLNNAIQLDTVLPGLFSHLVEVNEQEVATRRRVLQKDLSADMKEAADALADARLMVTGKGENDLPTVEVAHETVLSGWDRMRRWILEHAGALRARRDLEQAAGEWDKAGRIGSALRTGALLKRYESAAEPRSATAENYLAACRRRRVIFRAGFAGLGLLSVAMIAMLLHLNRSSYGPALAAKAMFVEFGLWPVPVPKMVTIPAESFEMGDLVGDGQPDELPTHTVHFNKPFELGQFEVTFAEYDLFAAATGREKPGDQGWGRDDRPVINVSWNDAVAYAHWLSDRTGLHYRLPSEAKWEYAARAGTKTARYWRENAEGEDDAACAYANVFDRQNEKRITSTYDTITWQPFNCGDEFAFTAPVGKFKPNTRGLYDMLGNVWEWTQDCYIDNYDDFPKDGTAREEQDNSDCSRRVLRGGSWDFGPRSVRSAYRDWCSPGNRDNGLGFRLARTP